MNKVFKDQIQRIAGLFGYRVVGSGVVGIDVKAEIARSEVTVTTVLDVGANIGQSSVKFLSAFPLAKIFAFEPVSENFLKLNAISDPRLTAIPMAVGSETGEIRIYLDPKSTKHSAVVAYDHSRYETSVVTTVDTFCKEQQIAHINFLKIDTEGNDLEVLLGASELLEASAIDFILVEAGFYPKPRHVLLFDVIEFLEARGYCLFSFYDQWFYEPPAAKLSHVNALFANENVRRKR